MTLRQSVHDLIEHLGYEARRHPAARRQQILSQAGIDVVFDVGAGKGLYGLQLRRFGYKEAIVSFEPLAKSYAKLKTLAAGDERWSALPFALSDHAGVTAINVADNGDSSSLMPMLDTHRAAAPTITVVGSQQVDTRRLDDVATDYLEPTSRGFLKIDTQGSERMVLDGAPKTLEKLLGLQIELSFVPLYEGSMLADEAIGWAYGQGFALVGIEPGFTSQTGQLMQADGIFIRMPVRTRRT